jgi:DNA-binding MarR family transcriptional regulator
MVGVKFPTDIRKTPATARLVYLALLDAPSLTLDQIEHRTGSPTRSVEQALGELRDEGFVERHPHPADDRRVLYSAVEKPRPRRE